MTLPPLYSVAGRGVWSYYCKEKNQLFVVQNTTQFQFKIKGKHFPAWRTAGQVVTQQNHSENKSVLVNLAYPAHAGVLLSTQAPENRHVKNTAIRLPAAPAAALVYVAEEMMPLEDAEKTLAIEDATPLPAKRKIETDRVEKKSRSSTIASLAKKSADSQSVLGKSPNKRKVVAAALSDRVQKTQRVKTSDVKGVPPPPL